MDTYWNSNFPVTSKRLQSLRVCLCVCVRARARPRLLTQSSPTWQSVMSDTSAQTVSLYCFLLHFSFEPQGGAITSRSPDLGGSMPSTGIRESGQFSCSVVSDSLWPHGLQHARLPCPSPIPGAYSNSCPLSRWCHATISSSVIPFSSRLQSFPASGSFRMSQFFASGGQKVLPMNIQDWFHLGPTGCILLLSKGLTRVFSNTTVQRHQFFGAQPSLWLNAHIHTWLLEKA